MIFHWRSNSSDFKKLVEKIALPAKEIENHITSQSSIEGWCSACEQIMTLTIRKPANGEWCDLRENIVCQCGLNGRMRSIINAFNQTINLKDRVLMMERVTPLFHRIQKSYPEVFGCEFLGSDLKSGSTHLINDIEVRHEDLLSLSYANESFDVVFHGDVLEHVPDHLAALRECHRVLKSSGTMLFTCPFFDFENHLVRAKFIGGKIHHILPPAYHGNPVSNQGSLVFMHHGWPLLSELLEVGFRSAEIGLLYDPFQGIVSNNNSYPEGHMWPVIFKAVK